MRIKVMKRKKIYSIWTEWDLGFDELYSNKKLAQKAIDDFDWEEAVNYTLEEVLEDGFVSIESKILITE